MKLKPVLYQEQPVAADALIQAALEQPSATVAAQVTTPANSFAKAIAYTTPVPDQQ